MSKLVDYITIIPSKDLQAIRFSLRHGYEESKRMRDSYQKDYDKCGNDKIMGKISFNGIKKHNKSMKTLELMFKQINIELKRRKKLDKLGKCYGDACHSKCSDNCSCGWCLMDMGWEALI